MNQLKLTGLLFFLFTSISEMIGQGVIPIIGTVVDVEKQHVFAADVLLKLAKSNEIIAYTTTDTLGNFLINATPNTYILEIRHLAFQSYKDSLNLSKKSILEQIILNPKEEGLSEVMITVSKPLLEKKIDRMIINVADRPVFAGSNSFDLLKRAPGIYTSSGDQLQLMGKSGMRLMLNGRMQNLTKNEITTFLKTLSAEEIKTIEIITTPPAKYEAEGNAGIINIITKTQTENGWSANFRLTGYQGHNNRFIGLIGFRYQKDQLNASLSYSGGNINSFEQVEQYNDLILPEGKKSYQSYNYERRSQLLNILRTQIDFNLNKNSIFSFAARTSVIESDHPSTNNTIQTDIGGSIIDSFQTFTEKDLNFTNYSADLYYEYTFGALNKKVSLSASSAEFGTQNNQNFTNLFGLHRTSREERLRSFFNNGTKIQAFKLDLSLPTKAVFWETGAKYGLTDANNNFIFENFQTNKWWNNPSLSNTFSYKEYNSAIYISMQKEFSNKWELKAGLRGEFSKTEGYSRTLDKKTEYDYFKLFPTFYLQYAASTKYKLNITYSRRINRPDYNDLNPFISYQSPLFSNQGNPLLRPEFTHSVEFNHIFKEKYILTPFYNLTQSYFTEFPKNVSGSTETRYTFGNLGNHKNFGLQAILPIRIAEKIQLQQTFLGMYQSYDISFDTISETPDGLFWMYQFSINTSLSKKLKAEMSGNYQSQSLQGFYKVENTADLAIGLRYSFLKEKASLNLSLSDILYSNRSKVAIEYPFQSLGFTRYNDTRLLKIRFSYRFGKKNLKENTSFGSASEEEQSRN